MRTRFARSIVLAIALLIPLSLSACATAGGVKPDVAVASYGTDILKAATELQRSVTQMTQAGILPVATARKITDQIALIDQKAGPVSEALKAYHVSTNPLDKQNRAQLIQTLIGQLNGPLANILGIEVPAGTIERITKLVGNTMSVIAAIQAEVAKGLGGGALLLPAEAR